jgi:hypothetical protein
MFECLDIGLEKEIISTDVVISEETLDFLIDNQAEIPHSAILRMKGTQTQQELQALITAIETYGISPALLAFANYNGVLSNIVPSIPSVEMLTTSEIDSTKILSDIKSLQLNNPEITSANEVFKFPTALIPAIWAAWGIGAIFQYYKRWKDDKANRVAEVVPFNELMKYLRAGDVVVRVSKELEHVILPKNKEEFEASNKKLNNTCAVLAQFGVHVSTDAILTSELPTAQKANIESLGYHENSLSQIATAVERIKQTMLQIKDFSTTSAFFAEMFDKQWSDDKTEQDYQSNIALTITYVIDAATTRLVKIVSMANKTVKAIAPYYKKD